MFYVIIWSECDKKMISTLSDDQLEKTTTQTTSTELGTPLHHVCVQKPFQAAKNFHQYLTPLNIYSHEYLCIAKICEKVQFFRVRGNIQIKANNKLELKYIWLFFNYFFVSRANNILLFLRAVCSSLCLFWTKFLFLYKFDLSEWSLKTCFVKNLLKAALAQFSTAGSLKKADEREGKKRPITALGNGLSISRVTPRELFPIT